MEALINKLRATYPQIRFTYGEVAKWSSKEQEITYHDDGSEESVWTLLHELGHGLLGHTSYTSDAALIQKEVAAWVKARELAKDHQIEIDTVHIEDCLDTYRDWLHKRSTCPTCNAQGLQQSQRLYACFNCQSTWKVTLDRFCRPYRLRKA